MALMDFIKKQFIDVIQWTEDSDGTLAWRFPMAGMEIQNGGQLVRESQMAVFVNEGQVADVFGPGTHKLTTQTLPVLTYLKNWDKLFESPFKSDVYFFSTRQQIDQRWGTSQPVTIRDKDFGAVRLRAFGNYAYRIPTQAFHTRSPARASATRCRPGRPAARPDAAAHQRRRRRQRHALPGPGRQPDRVRQALKNATAPFAALGLELLSVTMQNVSLPEELQKILDQRIGMGIIGQNMGQFMQYQAAQALPEMAKGAAGGGSGIAGEAIGLGAGVALGQTLAQTLGQGLAGVGAPPRRPPAASKPDDIVALLEKLGDLKAKGILTDEEFAAKRRTS
jgi:membrane protease subunit (stomatin/prohibitin family)